MTNLKRVKAKLKESKNGITVWDFPPGFALAARVKNLRDQGHNIISKIEKNTNNNGNHARYILIS